MPQAEPIEARGDVDAEGKTTIDLLDVARLSSCYRSLAMLSRTPVGSVAGCTSCATFCHALDLHRCADAAFRVGGAPWFSPQSATLSAAASAMRRPAQQATERAAWCLRQPVALSSRATSSRLGTTGGLRGCTARISLRARSGRSIGVRRSRTATPRRCCSWSASARRRRAVRSGSGARHPP